MRKWFVPLLIFSLALAACCLILRTRWSQKPEPSYNGRPLSSWLDDYSLMSHGFPGEETIIEKNNHVVDEAVRYMGTNAIPVLFEMLKATDSPTRRIGEWAYQHEWIHSRPTSVPALRKNLEAALAFGALGTNACEALPRLIDLYRQKNGHVQRMVALTLGMIGPPASNAVPYLLMTVTNQTGSPPFDAITALGRIHADPKTVVPALIQLLKHSNQAVRANYIQALEAYGSDAQPAVPTLIELLGDESESIRKIAAKALKVIDAEAAANAGVQ